MNTRCLAGLALACLPALGSAQVLVENATILTLAEGQDTPFTGYLLATSDGAIAAIGAGEYQGELPIATSVVDAQGKLLVPGFVSAHNHLWQTAFRGLAIDDVLYPWLQALHWTYGDNFSDGDFYWFTLHGAMDQLAHGITTTYSHSQRLGGSEEQYLESLTAEAGFSQHFVFSYNGNVNQAPAAYRKDFAAFMAKSEAIMAAPGSSMLAPAVHSVGLHGNLPMLKVEMEVAAEYGLGAQFHYLEQFSRRAEDRAEWPDLMAAGAVRKGNSFAHFIHTTDEIRDDTAAGGAGMSWNPLSNGRLASGLADIPDYLARGIPVGMGVDGAASADIGDPFENMRMGMYALRMQHKDAKIMSPLQVMKLHTMGSAGVMGVADKVGSLEVGKRADFLILDPDSPATGALFYPAAHIVATMSADNIDAVYVDGKLRVNNGEVLEQDMDLVQQEVERRVAAIVARENASKSGES
ncbi:amidohydrolase family protein [Haliea sp. E17]|uniref:amidohydrolase family protein n=1 Tax=Haliea sp. E17 TaxID=3401576 RepID=UPI003AACE4D7